MKRNLVRFFAIMLIFTLAFPTMVFADKPGTEYSIEDFVTNLLLEEDFEVFYDLDENVPTFITGFESEELIFDEEAAELFINGKKDLFDVSGGFDVVDTETDELNMTHFKTVQTMDGIQVYGGEMIVHTNNDGKVYAVNGKAVNKVQKANWHSKFKMNEKKAIKAAKADLDLAKVELMAEPTAEKFIYSFEGQNYATYLVTLVFNNPYVANYKLFVNAENGTVIDKYNAVSYAATTGTGVGTLGDNRTLNLNTSGSSYQLYDTVRDIKSYNLNGADEYSLPGTLMSDTDNVFDSSTQKPAVDMHFYLGETYDYFKNTHGRDSYDGNGRLIQGSVHYKTNENNAFYWNNYFAFGDGDGSQFSPLSGSLDVVAHEFTHAVTAYSANLEYRNQSGALNESMSDVFGAIVEYKFTGESDWWKLGEDVTTPGTPGDALRDMKDPTLYNQPAHMDNYQNVSYDNGGVHINSGIPNKAYYNVATVIGHDKGGAIWYRALTRYLTSTSQMADCRTAVLQATKDLYGDTGAEYKAVEDGFAAVGIGSSGSGGTGTWVEETISAETPHNYSNYYNNTKSYTKAGASKVGVYFQYLRTESGYDFVYIKDKAGNIVKTISGNSDDTWVEVDGDTIQIQIVSDYSVTDWGYRVTKAKYMMP